MNNLRAKIRRLFTAKYSWVTNGVMGATLFSIGDLLEQALEIRRRPHQSINLGRTGRMAAVGFVQGPGKQIFFWGLEKYFPGNSASSVWKKVVVDQFISCPVFYVQFFIGIGLLEGKSFQDAWEEFLRKFPTVYLVDVILWTPCQIINFRYVPVSHRVLFVTSLTVLWNVFLSYVKHYDQFEEPRIEECCRRGTCDCHQNYVPLTELISMLSWATKAKDSRGESEAKEKKEEKTVKD